jgi:hypothetical protein
LSAYATKIGRSLVRAYRRRRPPAAKAAAYSKRIFERLRDEHGYAGGITIYLTNGGDLEKAQQMAAHESPRTTKLYDR